MANILKRFGDIMSANINALLDKAEDPEKMIDKYIRDIEEDMRNVKAETAAVMAAETKAKRELTECQDEMAKMQRYAEKALTAGNEGDARRFLEKKGQLAGKQAGLQQAYDLAAANATKMKEMHDKLEEAGADVKLLVLEGADHADMPFFQKELWDRIVSFFREKLGAAGPV